MNDSATGDASREATGSEDSGTAEGRFENRLEAGPGGCPVPQPARLTAQTLAEALAASIDVDAFTSRLQDAGAPLAAPGGSDEAAADLQERLAARLVLADILDEQILEARPGDDSFALRLLLGELAADLDSELAFALCCSLNLYFRVDLDDDAKLRLGTEISRLFYRFASSHGFDTATVPRMAELLAQLLSANLERLSFEAVDRRAVFDSSIHERTADADPTSSNIAGTVSFLCRLRNSNRVRQRALVRT
ncbi:MAG: hypothetical protein HYV63_14390 [Candidatus Schekmanbacteria bacterium]|nr:hypothetical protein [Candidatus Schekmanbacteria bacterium]